MYNFLHGKPTERMMVYLPFNAKRKRCVRCGNYSLYKENITRKKMHRYLIVEGTQYKKVYCPYYPHSEIYHNAYYYSYNLEDTFKDAKSCCNCSHRIIDKDQNQLCEYDYLDRESQNMYYLEPLNKDTENTINVSVTYWICPICNAVHEISRKESSYNA